MVLEKQWSIGELWAVVALMILVFTPVRNLGSGMMQLQFARAALDRLQSLLGQTPEESPRTPGRPVEHLDGELHFEQLCFGYPSEPLLLKNFELRIKPGEKILISGENGSGKSTLLSLLLRLYRPSSGTIRCGEHSIEEYDLRSYRARIGYIGQRVEFFRGTLRENLSSNPDCSDQDIFAALDAVDMGSRIRRTEGLLDSMVQENAENFSGGEQLQLALARELLRRIDILILDESTSQLDAAHERHFHQLLQQRLTSQTVIFVTHRPPSSAAGWRTVVFQPERENAGNHIQCFSSSSRESVLV